MFKFLLGVLILASNFLVVSRAIAQMDAGSGLGVPTAAASPTPFCQTATQIKSLQDLRTNVGTTGNYCLANDIDASDTATNPFTPIGSQTTPFVGVFDGNGHVIDKLTLAPAVSTGFFGEVGSQGRVRNVGITNGKIGPSSNPAVSAGLLVGFNSGVVASCFATGTVASSASFVGGLIGDNHGTVTKSRARAMVIPSGGGGFATGGLVGFNDATISIAHATTLITQSYASGDVFGSGGNQSGSYGGFVGANNDAGATITKSYATGNVVGPPGGFDGGSVGGFVGLSAGGRNMVAEVFAGLSAIKTAFDIAKGLKDIDDAARRNAAVIELQEKILFAQAAQLELVETIGELKKRVVELEAWDADKKRYELKDIWNGSLAYAIKESMRGSEPPHNICANCYERGHKRYLQPRVTGFGRELFCSECNTAIFIGSVAIHDDILEWSRQKPTQS